MQQFFMQDEMRERMMLKQHIISTIDEAVANGYIRVFYQPVVHVVSGKLCGYEGLARWIDPVYGFLSPVDFIGTLEEVRQIHKLDSFMVRQICADTRRQLDEGRVVVPTSVNLSQLDFAMADMVSVVDDAVRSNGLSEEYLHVEITESAIDEQHIHRELKRFREKGYQLWMDDFGSGYSSLNVLKDFDFDVLKVDMRFLKDFDTNPRSRVILKNIMNMAKELGIQTLMEGVESEEVMEFLRQTGCEKAQGYLYGKPMPIEETYSLGIEVEDETMRDYCDAIAMVNLLSQTPLRTGWNSIGEDVVSTNALPLAIMEFDGSRIHFLMANDNFRKIFKSLIPL